ncbi:MAG: NAD(P)/FAD-dependent oxidoreductase [Methanosarcinaceae archaeon]|nr:NAD(P)/FAD-dependent oxidoreductase [Methanosarcinaceae archaeon]
MKAVIIGAGLGGLLSAARLSQEGYDVEIFECLPIIGGRFTNIDCQGFQLSTGALHMLPHGPTGPLAGLLNNVGADVSIVRSSPMAMIRIPSRKDDHDYSNGYKDIPFNKFGSRFSLWNRLKLSLLMITTRRSPPKKGTLGEWITKHLDEEHAHRTADAFCGWSLSLKNKEVPVEEAFDIFEKLYRYGGTGVPMGGCKSITDTLAEVIMANGGTIHTRTEVTGIITDNEQASGVIVNGVEHSADLVISDVGHIATEQLCTTSPLSQEYKQYIEELKDLKPSAGLKICLAANEPLIGHSGVLLTPYTRRVNGLNEVTNVDPNLAPADKHLIMAHQCVAWDRIDAIEDEIELGLQDLKEIFPEKNYEVLLIQSHHDDWPVNRSSSGMDISNVTPFEGLYVVGDGAKGKGGIEVEGVALGVINTMTHIMKNETPILGSGN